MPLQACDALCWGRNRWGKLGNGRYRDSMSPATVLLPSPATMIAAGREHSCAVTKDGAIYCWGDGLNGQRGDGDWALALTPQRVSWR